MPLTRFHDLLQVHERSKHSKADDDEQADPIIPGYGDSIDSDEKDEPWDGEEWVEETPGVC